MTELTKSAFSYAWAMSMFGVQQVINMLDPASADKIAQGLDTVSQAALGQPGAPGQAPSGPVMKMLEAPMALLGPFNPVSWLKMGVGMIEQMTSEGQRQPPPMLSSVLDMDHPSAYEPMDTPRHAPRLAPPSHEQGAGWGPMP